VAAVSLALLASACDDTVTKARSCEIDDEALPKAWFVGEAGADAPEFSLTITVTEANFAGGETSSFVGAVATTQVTAEISESWLTFREAGGGEVVSGFQISRHRTSDCVVPYDPTDPVDAPRPPPEPPWEERPWLRVDWSTDPFGAAFYAFDMASAAGYANAAEYAAINVYPANSSHDLDAGYLTFRTGTFVAWHDIDASTKGCALDLPDAAPGVACSTGELRLAYALRR
jgi:hypothetical protein